MTITADRAIPAEVALSGDRVETLGRSSSAHESTAIPHVSTMRQLAHVLGVDLATVWRWRHTGTGPRPTPVGPERKSVRYLRCDVLDWIAAQNGAAA